MQDQQSLNYTKINNLIIIIFRFLILFDIYFHYREFEDGASLDGSIENIERGSLASFGSGNTTDSDNLRVPEKVSAIYETKSMTKS